MNDILNRKKAFKGNVETFLRLFFKDDLHVSYLSLITAELSYNNLMKEVKYCPHFRELFKYKNFVINCRFSE